MIRRPQYRALMLCLAGMVGLGCGRDSEASSPQGSAGAAQDAAADQADAPPDVVSDEAGDTPADVVSGEAGDAPADVVAPSEIGSKQTVTFTVTNTGSAVQYLLTRGGVCTTQQIEKRDGAEWKVLDTFLTISEQWDTCCYGGCDLLAGPLAFEELAPGASHELTWDARAYLLSEETFSCLGKPGFHWGAPQPVAAGTYRVTVGVTSALPNNCVLGDGSTQADCSNTMMSTGQIPHLSLCPTSSTASAEFNLPDTGDLQVTIPIP